MWIYSSVHMKIADVFLCVWTDFSPPLSPPPSSLLSPFSAGCHLRLILVLRRLSHNHKMQSELFCSSATWGDHPAVLLKPEAACCLCSISCDIFVGEDQPIAGVACLRLTAVWLLVIYFPPWCTLFFSFFLQKNGPVGGDNLDCHREPHTLNLTAAQAQNKPRCRISSLWSWSSGWRRGQNPGRWWISVSFCVISFKKKKGGGGLVVRHQEPDWNIFFFYLPQKTN